MKLATDSWELSSVSVKMGNIDSLTELANTLDIFFKGLSECNVLTKYSLQLQATTVDAELQLKFQHLVYQFMKNLQTLLSKIPKIPGKEIGRFYDISTQTTDASERINTEIKTDDGPEIQPLVEFETESWNDEKHEIKEGIPESNYVNPSTDMIETYDPNSLTAIASNSIANIETHFDGQTSEHLTNIETVTLVNVPPESLMHVVVSSADSDDTQSAAAAIFICETCDKTFTSARSLGHHLGMKHRNKGQCDMCLQTFATVQSLQEHCRSEHGGSGCFTCSVCGRRFMTKLSYGRHIDTHNGKKGAVCDICGKMFSRADYLQKHYMTHTNTRPHSCDVCSKRFVSSSQLKIHEKTHTGLKDNVCEVCHKGFSRVDKLKEHMMRHLSIKRFTCSMCQRNYAEKRDLTKHLKLHVQYRT